MCSIDYCDARDRVHTTTHRRARKQHKCEECGRRIEAGERYRYTSGIDSDGFAFSHKLCSHCDVVAEWLVVNCGGWVRGGDELYEDIRSHGEDCRRFDLYRLAAGMRHQWVRIRSRDRMPVPALPRSLRLGDARA